MALDSDLPLDEREASLGLSVRLFVWQVPKAWHICEAMAAHLAEARARGWPPTRQARFLALQFLFYYELCGSLWGSAQWLQTRASCPRAPEMLQKCSARATLTAVTGDT